MKRIVAPGAVLSALLAALAVLPPTAAVGDVPATVSGTVARADDASPRGIVVTTRCANTEVQLAQPSFSTRAAADGSYAVALPPVTDGCTYAQVEFVDPHGTYAGQFYGGATFNGGDRVRIVPGDTALAPETMSASAGAIHGRVVNTYGRPVRARDLRVRAWCCDGYGVPVPTVAVGPRGGFTLRGLLPARRAAGYEIDSEDSRRYHGASLHGRFGVTAGRTTRVPTLVVKDLARWRIHTTWRPRSVTVHVAVSSAVTRRPASGRLSVVMSHHGRLLRRAVDLRAGQGQVTFHVRHRASAAVLLTYGGSRHVAGDQRRQVQHVADGKRATGAPTA